MSGERSGLVMMVAFYGIEWEAKFPQRRQYIPYSAHLVTPSLTLAWQEMAWK
jgi:hypothetical protein